MTTQYLFIGGDELRGTGRAEKGQLKIALNDRRKVRKDRKIVGSALIEEGCKRRSINFREMLGLEVPPSAKEEPEIMANRVS